MLVKKKSNPVICCIFSLIKLKSKSHYMITILISSWLQILALAMQICPWCPTRLMGGSRKLLPSFPQTGFASRNHGIWHSIPGVIIFPFSFLQFSPRAKFRSSLSVQNFVGFLLSSLMFPQNSHRWKKTSSQALLNAWRHSSCWSWEE